MPSTSDDSPGTAGGASAGFLAPKQPGFSAGHPAPVAAASPPHPAGWGRRATLETLSMPATDPAGWLTEYVAGRLLEAGVSPDDAPAAARRMSSDIAAAFATLHRVDVALDQAGVTLDS